MCIFNIFIIMFVISLMKMTIHSLNENVPEPLYKFINHVEDMINKKNQTERMFTIFNSIFLASLAFYLSYYTLAIFEILSEITNVLFYSIKIRRSES